MGSEALSFAACQDLSSNLAATYNLLYTLTDNGNGTSMLSGAFERAADEPSWAAFGLPPCQSDGCGMLHGSAIIAKTCASCASGAPRPPACMCWPGSLPAQPCAYICGAPRLCKVKGEAGR